MVTYAFMMLMISVYNQFPVHFIVHWLVHIKHIRQCCYVETFSVEFESLHNIQLSIYDHSIITCYITMIHINIVYTTHKLTIKSLCLKVYGQLH